MEDHGRRKMPGDPKKIYGDLKPPLHLIPGSALVHLSLALKDGADKYGAYNWRQDPVEANTYVGALLRHVMAYKEAEDLAPDSGRLHLAHVMACCAILIDAAESGTLIDNRYQGPAAKVLEREKKPAPAEVASVSAPASEPLGVSTEEKASIDALREALASGAAADEYLKGVRHKDAYAPGYLGPQDGDSCGT